MLNATETISNDALGALGLRPETQSRETNLGQDDFLTLMTTQLQAQDPLKPLENGDFIAQLAQFSTVAGMDTLVDTVQSLASSLSATQTLDAAALVGRSVLVPSAGGAAAGSSAGAVDVPAGTANVEVRIENSSGEVLERVQLGDSGTDALLPFVAPVSGDEPGLRYIAEGNVAGERTELPILLERNVAAVQIGQSPGGLELHLDDGSVTQLGSVRQVR